MKKKTTQSFHCQFFFTHRKKKSHHMSFWGNTWPLRQHISGSQLSFPDQQLASISYAVQHRMQQLNILLLYCSSWIGDKKISIALSQHVLPAIFFFFLLLYCPVTHVCLVPLLILTCCHHSSVSFDFLHPAGGKNVSVSTQSPWMDSTVAFPLKREETIHIHTDVAH